MEFWSMILRRWESTSLTSESRRAVLKLFSRRRSKNSSRRKPEYDTYMKLSMDESTTKKRPTNSSVRRVL